ncbi:MAG: hypothetical protein RAK22_02330, partial [Nanoarchaeota archaeon]|nr:hypothetical protein [Nanoarchaeota archaeon]
MVPRLLKQIAAILIAIAFIASLFFFIPKQANSNNVSLIVLVPTQLLRNQTTFNQYNSNFSIIAEQSPIQISVLSAENITSLLNLTTTLFKFSNISYSVSNGQICLPASTLFLKNICDTKNSFWLVYESENGQTPTLLNKSLSKIELGSLYSPQNE